MNHRVQLEAALLYYLPEVRDHSCRGRLVGCDHIQQPVVRPRRPILSLEPHRKRPRPDLLPDGRIHLVLK